MKGRWRKLIVVACASVIAGAFSASAGSAPLHKCNAGGGNGYESTATNDCDPGNSGGNNNGGG